MKGWDNMTTGSQPISSAISAAEIRGRVLNSLNHLLPAREVGTGRGVQLLQATHQEETTLRFSPPVMATRIHTGIHRPPVKTDRSR